MNIQFYCPRWGSENLSWDLFFEKAVAAGYDGVEFGIGNAVDMKELDEIWNLAEKYKMKLIAQCWENSDADFSKHLDVYCAWFEKIKPYPVIKIDSQTGREKYACPDHCDDSPCDGGR